MYYVVWFSDDAIYEDGIDYADNNINDGTNLIVESPYKCWDLCKKTESCIGIVWGKCDSNWVPGRKTCWMKSALVGRKPKGDSVAIIYKGTKYNTICTFSMMFFKMFQQICLFFVFNILRVPI